MICIRPSSNLCNTVLFCDIDVGTMNAENYVVNPALSRVYCTVLLLIVYESTNT